LIPAETTISVVYSGNTEDSNMELEDGSLTISGGYMTRCNTCFTGLVLVLTWCPLAEGVENASATDPSVFVGSSPCDTAIRQPLGIPADTDANLIQWRLTLHQDPQTREPAGYQLRFTYGATVQGTPGLAGAKTTVDRKGRWTLARGTKSNPDTVVYELADSVAFCKIGEDLLHVLDSDRRLMVGNGGWSYTLNRLESAEKPGDHALALAAPSVSYRISPLATGPAVFGVFEGRTPALGIARELKLPAGPGSIKAKWRVTLYQDPKSGTPANYKVEGTLHRQAAREGKWTIDRAGKGTQPGEVYRLEHTKNGEPPILLVKGDDHVLFFLDQQGKPLVGHADFSYTLDRRAPAAQAPPSQAR
jgi:hypothetical protein